MRALTPSERRGALIVVLLLALGAIRDLIVARLAPIAPVPRATSEPAAPAAEDPPPGDPRSTDLPEPVRIDLNTATVEDLDRLPGIGPVLARRILEQRRRVGRFHAPDELRAVRGVGPRLLERLRPRVTVGEPGARRPVASPRPPGRDVQSAREWPPHAADSAQVRARAIR